MNYIDTTAFTANYPMNGIIGALEQDSMFLKDGMYSLWTHAPDQEKSNTNGYTVNPFFMAKSRNGWFGVFINNAAAQDWNVFNDPMEGQTRLTIRATGGVGDIFVLLANTPELVVQSYQKNVVG